VKLNLGCGFQTPDGWVNVDYAFGARLSRMFLFRALNNKMNIFGGCWAPSIFIHNLREKLPWADDSVDVVYSSHTLEHFTKPEGRQFLEECHRVLRCGGVVRIIVPDLSSIIQKYNSGDLTAPDFMKAIGVVHTALGFLCINYFKNYFSSHKCMYDSSSLVDILNDIGFSAKKCSAFESEINDIETIEQVGRTLDAVIVEGRKK